MRRSCAPAFVVTLSAVAACATSGGRTVASEPTTAEPAPSVAITDPEPEPEPEREPDTVPADGGAAPEPDEPPRMSDYPTTLNPRDASNRTIKRMWQGDQCYVELPFPALGPGQMRPPGSAPPAQTIACPPSMLTPTFEQCRGGVVQAKADGSACICFVMGNPPPPPKRIECPATKP